MSKQLYDFQIKFMLLGDTKVGKTAIIDRFCNRRYNPPYAQTQGLDYGERIIEHCHKRIKVQVREVAGDPKFNTATSSFYNDVNGFIIVYDITNPESFEHLSEWLEVVEKYGKPGVEKVILANKIDLAAKRYVEKDRGQLLAFSNDAVYLETSAKSNTKINKAFFDLTQTVLQNLYPDACNLSNRAIENETEKERLIENETKNGPDVEEKQQTIISKLKKLCCCCTETS